MLKYQKQKERRNEYPIATAALFIVSAAVFAFVIVKIDFTRLVFGEIKQVKPQQVQSSALNEIKPSLLSVEEPISNIKPQALQPEHTDNSSIYRYEDDNGLIVMVSDLERVPVRYRPNMKVLVGETQNRHITVVTVNNNRVYVPVTIGYQGRSVNVQLLLDTGATGVTISPSIASRLGIVEGSGYQNTVTMADGRKINAYVVTAEHVTVGPKSKKGMELQVMPNEGTEYSGLLGMSFLSEFPHMIDTRSQLIKWM